MFPLTLREDKGSPLTHQEMDNNLKHVMFPPFLHIQDQKPQGTSGGTFTSGAWRTRDLNTVLTNTINGASLATNQITLPAGKYYVEAGAIGYKVGRHQTRIYDTTDNSMSILGFMNTSSSANNDSIHAEVDGVFDISVESVIELQHRCLTTINTNGFGYSGNWGTEIYSDIRIWRIGDAD